MHTTVCMFFQTSATYTCTSQLTLIQYYGFLNTVTFECHNTRRECKDGSGPNYNMHLIAYIIQITILQSRSFKSKQLKKPPLYTRTKYYLILDFFGNKTHPDTQTRIHTITALVFVYHQLKNNKRRWTTMYNTQRKILINLLH